MALPFGKLDHDRRAGLLARCTGKPDRAVLVGPAVGQDAAAIRVGGEVVVAATDPITFAAERISGVRSVMDRMTTELRGAMVFAGPRVAAAEIEAEAAATAAETAPANSVHGSRAE